MRKGVKEKGKKYIIILYPKNIRTNKVNGFLYLLYKAIADLAKLI